MSFTNIYFVSPVLWPQETSLGGFLATGVWALVPALPKHLEMKLVIVQGPARLAL